MPLSVRPPIQTLPSYSLTGDLLGFLRCGLQYRYSRLGKLPPSHPVQLWFGQFIHAVLEESYRQVKEKRKSLPPWSDPDLLEIFERIDRRLAARNIICWNEDSQKLGYSRATSAVNELGPLLFPLINQAEVRVRGARKLPAAIIKLLGRDMERYEMLGVIDVVTQVELFSPKHRGNKLLELMVEELPENPPDEFEVIVDYKGMKRPAQSEEGENVGLWEIYEWQVHTYAHLRSLLTTKPIIAGVVVYLNELVPTKSDLIALQIALKRRTSTKELLPELGSKDEALLRDWKFKEQPMPKLSRDFRLQRAIRVIPISPMSIRDSLNEFDGVVGRIEKCLMDEASTGKLISSWDRNATHEPTCAACDTRTFCPDFTTETSPRLPGFKL
ncbi:MAG: hypothetical protein JWL59_4816 [Chthoniobacteraceae bacterium]|nr:hypothetical protein [Chthoniobacteraceae bacterium]